MTKHCRRCGQDKPTSEFWENGRNRDGLQDYCKACHQRTVLTWRKENARSHNMSGHRRSTTATKAFA
jgi:hypothetical protein